MLEARGFARLVGTQCTFSHPSSGVLVVARVDELLVLGRRADLLALRNGLATEGYEVTGSILGKGADDVKQLKFLGRTITLTDEGLEWAGDEKHATAYLEKLLAEFGTEGSVEGGSGKTSDMGIVKTPGVKREELGEVRVPLIKSKAKAYRGLAALGNYMGQDRPDIGFCTKDANTSVSDPCECDVPALTRLGRYLRRFPVCAFLFRWQAPPESLDGCSDADLGGCVTSKRSTSGGCVLHGGHVSFTWGSHSTSYSALVRRE